MGERRPMMPRDALDYAMPKAPAGFVACRVHDGTQDLWAQGASRQVSHLVALDESGSNGGRPTVCGLTRFPTDERPPDLPGWGMGDSGVMGPNVMQIRCGSCWATSNGNPLCPTCPDRSRANPVTQEIEGRVLVCDDCAADEELRDHARRDWR